MKNTTERFTQTVQDYIKYRPSYPKEVLDVLMNNLFRWCCVTHTCRVLIYKRRRIELALQIPYMSNHQRKL